MTYDTVIGWWLSWRKNNRIPFCCVKKLMKDSFPFKDVVGGGDIGLLQLGNQSRDGQDLRRKSVPVMMSEARQTRYTRNAGREDIALPVAWDNGLKIARWRLGFQ